MRPLGHYINNPRKLLSVLVVKLNWLFPDAIYLKIRYYLYFGKRLNLKDPKTFSEKIQWLKLYNKKPEYTMMVDKYAVKEYVKSIIGEKYIIPTLGVWNSFDDIDFDSLPDKFVLKTTNGGGNGGVVICKDKKQFNKNQARKRLVQSLGKSIYSTFREYPYKDVPRRIIAETYMQNADDSELTDYKFFCFNGVPHYCQVIADRRTCETIDFYDTEWNHQEFIGLLPVGSSEIKSATQLVSKPTRYAEMLEIAAKLAKGHSFLRVDLYSINNEIYFGELTFFPASGFGVFNPEKWNEKLGEMIEIDANLWNR